MFVRQQQPQRCRLFAAILMGLALPAAAFSASAQEAQAETQDAKQDAEKKDKSAQTLEKVQVTGSRIKRAELEGPTPIVTITAEDIKKQGFSTIAEVMMTLPSNNGDMVAGELNGVRGNTQQPDAQYLNLRGLGVGYQLVLVNGNRMADYAASSTPDATGVSLGSIPAAAVERIEVLNNGASAIYGSDAVAGVVNIVTKENWEGNHLRIRGGTTTNGGGDTGQIQFTGGKFWDRGSITYAFEQLNREKIAVGQRKYIIPDAWNFPGNEDPSRPTYAPLETYVWSYGWGDTAWLGTNGEWVLGSDDVDGAAVKHSCANASPAYAAMYSGDNDYPTWCGTMNYYDGAVLSNEYNKTSGYLAGNFKLTDNLEAYGQLLVQRSRSTAGNVSAQYLWGYGYDDDLGYFVFERALDPGSLGKRRDRVWGEDSAGLNIGLRGTIADRFDWDASFGLSRSELHSSWSQLLQDRVEAWLLGPRLGETGWGAPYYVRDFDPNKVFGPVNADEYATMSEVIHNRNISQATQVQFVFSGPLFELPAGEVQMAAVVEAARSKLFLNPDYRSLGTYTGTDRTFNYTATSGGGERDRYGAGLELRIPLLRSLTAGVAGRWDKYDDISDIGGATTWQAGLEWRPVKSLLVRASRQTSFMAPNIMWIYGRPVTQFGTFTNEYLCREAGLDLTVQADVSTCYGGQYRDSLWYTSGGNSSALHEETATSSGFGFVWDVARGLSISADWWAIELEGQSAYLSTVQVLNGNADCLLGVTTNGEAVDPNSAKCNAYAQYVTRDADGHIKGLSVGAINEAGVRTSGFDASLKYAWSSERLGNFFVNAGMSKTLKYEVKVAEGDPWKDYMDCSYGQASCDYSQPVAFRTRTNWTLAWNKGDWAANLYGWRNGSRVNYQGTGRLDSFVQWNGGVSKKITDKMRLGVDVVNLFDKYAPKDKSLTGWPFYQYIYGITGRAVYVNLDIDF
ncbi:MAG: TonB-dependent receptor [Pseudoxanthomonas sp.]